MSSDYKLPEFPPDYQGLARDWLDHGHACAEAGRAPLAEENARLLARIAELEHLKSDFERLIDAHATTLTERDRLRAEVETERMRLAACGVIALSNTPESAAEQRKMLPEYWSDSAKSVAAAVDREMHLLADVEAKDAALAALQADAERYREVRRGQTLSVVDWIGADYRAESADAAVDAAIAARKGGNGRAKQLKPNNEGQS